VFSAKTLFLSNTLSGLSKSKAPPIAEEQFLKVLS